MNRLRGREVAGLGVMPASALVLSYVILDEAWHGWHGRGLSLVLGAMALLTRDHQRQGS